MTAILGLIIIYSVVHFFVIQQKAYRDRTQYEKVVSWVAMIGISLIFIGVAMGNN